MFENLTLTLAQEDAPPAVSAPTANAPANGGGDDTSLVPSNREGQQAPPPQSPFGGMGFVLIMVGMIAVMMIFSSRSQAKEKKKRQEMLAALKKGDKVETVGGILGAVVEVRENDVVLKVDENANTRIKFSRAAIRSVVTGTSDISKEEIKDTQAS